MFFEQTFQGIGIVYLAAVHFAESLCSINAEIHRLLMYGVMSREDLSIIYTLAKLKMESRSLRGYYIV